MAGMFTRSRPTTQHLITKVGFLENLKWVFGYSSLHHRPIPSATTPIHATGKNPVAVLDNLMTLFAVRRFSSIRAGEECAAHQQQNNDADRILKEKHMRRGFKIQIVCNTSSCVSSFNQQSFIQVLAFPGGPVLLTAEMKFIFESPVTQVPCYRVLDDDGQPIAGSSFQQVSKEFSLKMYEDMVTLQIMDTIFYEAQRQGRISFYLTTIGEEAINIASAAALTIDDVVFPQYREPGVLLWRGFTLQEFANQCFGNKADYGKGRQMPIHYGSNRLNYFTVSSPIATQIPHAVGAAYSLKMDQKKACAVTYFGDGGSSEGDFHAALNFAAVMEVPVIFICRNNGWAISTPTSEQFRSDGLTMRGPAYGIQSIRVDGNDTLAVYSAVRAAREIAITGSKPILIEAMTYRTGHHSTSDDSTKYRPADEIENWRTNRDPVSRFRKWVESNSWWSDAAESELRTNVRNKLLNAIQNAEKAEKPPLADMFTDVYDDIPSNLREQERRLRETIEKHPEDYPTDIPV